MQRKQTYEQGYTLGEIEHKNNNSCVNTNKIIAIFVLAQALFFYVKFLPVYILVGMFVFAALTTPYVIPSCERAFE